MHFTEDGILKTTDTALAAYLTIKGYKLLRLEITDSGQALFHFTDSPDLQALIDPFYSGELYHFFKVYRGILKRIKNSERGNI